MGEEDWSVKRGLPSCDIGSKVFYRSRRAATRVLSRVNEYEVEGWV